MDRNTFDGTLALRGKSTSGARQRAWKVDTRIQKGDKRS